MNSSALIVCNLVFLILALSKVVLQNLLFNKEMSTYVAKEKMLTHVQVPEGEGNAEYDEIRHP